jgi:hypothetical protein
MRQRNTDVEEGEEGTEFKLRCGLAHIDGASLPLFAGFVERYCARHVSGGLRI